MKIEDRLFGVMSGFMSVNDYIDKHMDLPPEMLKSRGAIYGLVRIAIIAEDFITESGLDADYKKFEAKVNDKLGNLIVKLGKE